MRNIEGDAGYSEPKTGIVQAHFKLSEFATARLNPGNAIEDFVDIIFSYPIRLMTIRFIKIISGLWHSLNNLTLDVFNKINHI